MHKKHALMVCGVALFARKAAGLKIMAVDNAEGVFLGTKEGAS
jgi:hypothetical protein